MKIRTDFVTNSSSYSSAEIVIDNPVLLEILQKYKDNDAFEGQNFDIGGYDTCCFSQDTIRELIKTPALYVYEEESYCMYSAPERLGDVLNLIISYLEDHLYDDEELLNQILTELDERREDIESAYKQVVWKYGELCNEGNEEVYNGYIDETYLFKFDTERGEEYYHSRAAGPGSDKEIEEGHIFFEEHKINGKDVESKDVDDDKDNAR